MNDLLHLGRTFRKLRRRKGLAQKVVGIDSGLTASNVSYIEWHTRYPQRATVQKLCDSLGITVGTLLLHAINEADIPSQYREDFKTLRDRMI